MKTDLMQTNTLSPLRPGMQNTEQRVQEAEELHDTFRTFVGEFYFGQLLKSMQSTVGKPAYFHGGQAEEIFRGQLNQTLSQEMTKASADTIAEPMFRQQFPKQAELLQEASGKQAGDLADLDQLRRW